jgi:hypothetical protein
VPNPAAAGIISCGQLCCFLAISRRTPPELRMTRRRPIDSGFIFAARAKRARQSCGSSSTRPPNSATSCSARDRVRQQISSCERQQRGRSIMANPPRARFCRNSSRARTHRRSANFRQRYNDGISDLLAALNGNLFFLGGLFVLHLRHLLRKTGDIFFVLHAINREFSLHVVRILEGPILIGIGIGHR